ncbi:hypothetical protein DFH07DRAFT_973015 [Mycena maculata]|uniref:Uncharacterized protein n=1 Tax=Mycena maculata TaxID=230809 RepID=A0AAD7MIL6_9AGAR|nr:hypothetical protein DFH07DRAFT_973015 [Mycena maculata]
MTSSDRAAAQLADQETAAQLVDEEAAKALKKKKDLPPRSPSKRAGRALCPEGPDMPPTRRTAAELAEEDATKAEQRRALQHTIDVAIAAVAAMDAEQDAAAAQEQADAVFSTEDLDYLNEYNMEVALDARPAAPADSEDPKDSDTEFLEVDDAAFARLEDDEAYLLEDPFAGSVAVGRKTGKGKAKAWAPKKVKKFSKGELRAAIEDKVQEKKAQQGTTSDAAAASKEAGVISKFQPRHVAAKVDSPLSSPLGGLADADAVSIHPQFAKKALKGVGSGVAGPSKVHKNETVVIDDSSDDEVVAVRAPVKLERRASVKLPMLDLRQFQKPAPTIRKPKTKIVVPATSSDTFALQPTTTTPNALPSFVADKWNNIIMLALHRALNESENPWELGLQNDGTLEVIQTIINQACPRNTYKATWGDPIVSRFSARCAEHRSVIGTAGVDIVAEYIVTNEKIFSTTQAIKDYARYALNKRGPALWKEPTPLKHIAILDKNDPKYVKAKGLFESDFVISIVAPILKVGSSGHPFGAMALAAAAVEHGWIKHQTGEFVGSSKFAKNTAGAAVDGYLVSARQLSVNAWQRIIEACNEHTAQAPEEDFDESAGPCLDGFRENLYEPSSP